MARGGSVGAATADRGWDEKLALCRRVLWPSAYVAVGVAPAPGLAEAAAAYPRCGAGPMVPVGEVPAADTSQAGAAVAVDSS
jgi:hypothetical protein